MSDFGHRLVQCFSAVFPDLTEQEIRAADLEIMETRGVDSLAWVTLLSVIIEEFTAELSLDDLFALRTFDAVQRHLNTQNPKTLYPIDQMK